MERAASTEEIVTAITAFRDALSPANRFVEQRFLDSGFRRGASKVKTGEQHIITQYVRGNLVADVHRMDRIDGATIKARITSPARLSELSKSLIDGLGLKTFEGLDQNYIQAHNLNRLDPAAVAKMYFAERFILVLEQSNHNNQTYVAVTFGPFPTATQS